MTSWPARADDELVVPNCSLSAAKMIGRTASKQRPVSFGRWRSAKKLSLGALRSGARAGTRLAHSRKRKRESAVAAEDCTCREPQLKTLLCTRDGLHLVVVEEASSLITPQVLPPITARPSGESRQDSPAVVTLTCSSNSTITDVIQTAGPLQYLLDKASLATTPHLHLPASLLLAHTTKHHHQTASFTLCFTPPASFATS